MINRLAIASVVALSASFTTSVEAVEVTPFVEYVISDDLTLDETDQTVSVDDVVALGLSVGWPESQLGQGVVSISYGSYDYEANNDGEITNSSFDLVYAHFNGVAHYRNQNYTTTVGFGIGGTYVSDDSGDSELYPSATAAIGTRYKISDNLALMTELRGYATFAEDDSTVFCRSGAEGSQCHAQFDGDFWVDAAIRFGVAYTF